MRSLSTWAMHHPWTARILIITSSILLTGIAFLAGCISYDEGHRVSPGWMWLLAFVVLLSCAFYPGKRNSGYRSYKIRKSIDIILATCSFLLLACTANQHAAPLQSAPHTNAYTIESHASIATVKPGKPSFKQQKRMAKQWLKAYRDKYKKASPTSKALLIFLTVLVAAGLIVLVAALACGIACSSSEALALIVLLLGVTGVVLLARMVILRIRYGPKVKPKTEPIPST